MYESMHKHVTPCLCHVGGERDTFGGLPHERRLCGDAAIISALN